jgi:UDP-glucuronate 4-epimerase
MNPTTLITGAAGFIGSSLTDLLLSRGHNVVGFDNFNDFYPPAAKRKNIAGALSNPRFTLIEGDIRDRDAVFAAFAKHEPKGVVHLAAMAGVRPSIENPALYTAVNLDGTTHMLDAAVEHGAERFIFASSSSVYGNNPKTPFAEEDRVDHPISPYAATKKAGELLCHTYWHIHKLPVTCLRFFTVFGPRQRPDLAISKFLKLVNEGSSIPMFGNGSTSRDYTFIEDILAGVAAALEHCGPGSGYRVYNLGGNHPTSLSELIETIQQVVGRRVAINEMPMQPGDVERTWADLTLSRKELGYSPKTSMRDGIAKQWEWLRGS